MAQSIFSTDEQNVVLNAVRQQIELSKADLDSALQSDDYKEVAINSNTLRLAINLVSEMMNFTCQWIIPDYEIMVKPLEHFIEMATDCYENDDLAELYIAVAALAKIKIHFVLFK